MSATVTDELRSTAYHEAGHVAASYFLRVPFKYVTITESEDALGHVDRGRMSDALVERIEAGSYSGFGGIVDARDSARACRRTDSVLAPRGSPSALSSVVEVRT